MPHCIVEYSANLAEKLDLTQLMVGINQVILSSNLFEPDALKIRLISYDNYLLSNQYQYFIHTKLSILEGRTDLQKASLARAVQEFFYKHTKNLSISLTTEICDIHKNSYQKL